LAAEHVERRLAAIVATDMVGFSRLMEADEEGTLARQKAHRAELLDPAIAEHRGRIVKTTGDGLLIEFASAVDAVRCAVAMQVMLAEHETDVPEDHRILYRIGINLGDIITDGDDIYGNGVNIAARLEALADPGGVFLSRPVYDQVERQTDFAYEYLGEQRVKNIAEPVRCYRVGSPLAVTTNLSMQPSPVSDKPSIAVLPFNNLSGDPDQEYFADGMTEDIITGLSRFRSLSVIARNSTFAYKGKSVDVRDVAQDLGVSYVLEGSVRSGSGRIRITAQLIDAQTGNHLWAERYDRQLQDIFAVQDEVTDALVAAIAPEVGDAERKRSERKPPGSLEAWDIYQRGLADYHSSTEDSFRSAIAQFDRVNEIDPDFAPAFAMAAGARWRYVLHFNPDNRGDLIAQASEKAGRAVLLDQRDPLCLANDGRVHSMLGRHDIALAKVDEAIALNPHDATVLFMRGAILCSAGRAEEAISQIDDAMRLSPHDMSFTGMLTHRAFVLFDLERYEEAFDGARRASLRPNPRSMTFALLAAVLVKLGCEEEARLAVDGLLAHAPEMSCAKYRDNPFGTPTVMQRFVDALRIAGLPA